MLEKIKETVMRWLYIILHPTEMTETIFGMVILFGIIITSISFTTIKATKKVNKDYIENITIFNSNEKEYTETTTEEITVEKIPENETDNLITKIINFLIKALKNVFSTT